MASPGFGTPKTSLSALDETKGAYEFDLNWCGLAIPSLEYQPEMEPLVDKYEPRTLFHLRLAGSLGSNGNSGP